MIVYQSRTDCLVLVTIPGFDGGGGFEAVLGSLAGILSVDPTGALPPAGGPTGGAPGGWAPASLPGA
jgi:hypothetical protein